jgi:hypothetical protein
VNLNPGGFIGALVPLAGGILIVWLMVDPKNEEAFTWATRSIIALLITGAFVGNYLWELFFGKPPKPPRDRQVMP